MEVHGETDEERAEIIKDVATTAAMNLQSVLLTKVSGAYSQVGMNVVVQYKAKVYDVRENLWKWKTSTAVSAPSQRRPRNRS